jgi:pyrroline-5-carboxylate reductase
LALTDLSGISPAFTQMLTQALVLSGGVQVK